MRTFMKALATAFAIVALTGCSGMSTRDRNTAVGAVVGGVAGSALTDSTVGTLGGAAIGGYIGNRTNR